MDSTMADAALSPSERQTLKHVAEGELFVSEMDWLALQRLKRLGLLKDGEKPALTQAGRDALRRLAFER
jgi:hypothetical protein